MVSCQRPEVSSSVSAVKLALCRSARAVPRAIARNSSLPAVELADRAARSVADGAWPWIGNQAPRSEHPTQLGHLWASCPGGCASAGPKSIWPPAIASHQILITSQVCTGGRWLRPPFSRGLITADADALGPVPFGRATVCAQLLVGCTSESMPKAHVGLVVHRNWPFAVVLTSLQRFRAVHRAGLRTFSSRAFGKRLEGFVIVRVGVLAHGTRRGRRAAEASWVSPEIGWMREWKR